MRLYEGTNRIQFIYGAKSAGTPNSSSSASIGIKGRNTLPEFFIDGTTGSRVTGLSSLTSATGFPASGAVFTFAPDTVAPAGLIASPGHLRADLVWRRSRLPTLIGYRIYVGTSPTTMVLQNSTAGSTDTTLALTGLVNGTTYYVGVTGVGPGSVESGFAQVVAVIPANSLPAVSLTAPAAGSLLAPGSTVNITATATDADGTVTVVEFLRGGVKIGEDFTSPYEYAWTAGPSGIHTLTARAIDNNSAAIVSIGRSVTVDFPPQVDITNPANGALVNLGTPITFSAAATDLDGTINRVEYYRGNLLIGSSSIGSTFNYTWSNPLPGDHVITARAFDNLGIADTSAPITLSVNTPPTVSLTAPAHFSGFTTGSSIPLTAAATDTIGTVAEVQFYRDSIFIGSSTSGPSYPVTWSNAAPGRYRLQARAVDSRGLIGYSQALTVFVNDSAKAQLGGRLFITGHDADNHVNLEFTSAGLDYLFFGKAAGANDQPYRLGARVAFLGNTPALQSAVMSYPQPVFIDLDLPGWDALAFPSRPFDVIIVGTGLDYISNLGSTSLNAQKAKFETYFNNGGGIFVMSEQGIGQTFYNFLPSFATARQQNISASGAFTATPAGLAIGLTEAIVDRDLTHTEFLDVDTTLFRIFEFYNPDLLPVSIGASALIEGNIFVPKDSVVADPQAFSRDTVFLDTLCIRFESPTAGASLYLTRDGGKPDTSSLSIPSGEFICIDASTVIRVIGKMPGMRDSYTASHVYTRMQKVAMPVADAADSTFFRDSLCFGLSSATPGAHIHYTLDGGAPDTAETHVHNGDSLCVDRTVTVRFMAELNNWIESDGNSVRFFKMDTVATPRADWPDSTHFANRLCVRLSSATAGAVIHYTLDGGSADTSGHSIANGATFCVDKSIQVRAAALQKNWIPSDETVLSVYRMETVAAPKADRPDSTWFEKSLCVKWTTATPGAIVNLTGMPSDSSRRTLASGDSVCLDRSATLRAMASLENWKNSEEVSRVYLKMDTVAKPFFDRGDTVFYPSICARVSSATPGAILQYTLDGGNPDTSALTKTGGDTICVDRSVEIRVIGTRKNSIPSEETILHLDKMPKVAPLKPSIGDTVVFARRICFTLVSATDSVRIRYTLDGSDPLEGGLSAASGESICLDSSAVFVAVGTRPLWRNSDPIRISLEVDNEGPFILKAEKKTLQPAQYLR